MNRTRLMMIGALALAIAFLVSVIVYKNLQGKMGSSDPGMQVMVAANDLQVGSRVEEHDVRIISVPAADLPPGAPRKSSDVIGHGVISPISKGEFILPNRLAAENAGAGLPSLIPPGMRAVSVRVNDVASVSGFVTPGTRVDVLVTASLREQESRKPPQCYRTSSTGVRSHIGAELDGRGAERGSNHITGDSGRCAAPDSCHE